MLAILDYGVGNLFSLRCSLSYIGQETVITKDPAELRAADRIILPGVGAFEDAIRKLKESGLCETLLQRVGEGVPLLGICLGMQLLFEKSLEFGTHEGLGLIPGSIEPLAGSIDPQLKIPHIGWNALQFPEERHPLFSHTREGDCVYFVHSFYASGTQPYVIATADYGTSVAAAVAKGRVMGCQFHPEKSGAVGLDILRAFCESVV